LRGRLRIEPGFDGKGKTFVTAHVHEGKVYGLWPEGLLPLFMNDTAHKLLAEGKLDEVIVVEGEKKAITIDEFDEPAVSSPLGADKGGSKMMQVDWSILAGRSCVFWSDFDPIDKDGDRAGEVYMKNLAKYLGETFDITPYWIDVEKLGLPEKGDVADFIECERGNGATFEVLRDMLRTIKADAVRLPTSSGAPDSTRKSSTSLDDPKGTSTEIRQPEKLTRTRKLRTRCAADIEARVVEWFWRGRIVKNAVNVIAGPGGVGKSFLTTYMAAMASTGGNWPDGGDPVDPCDVLMLCAEDDQSCVIKPRLVANGAACERIEIVDTAVKISPDGKETEIAFTLDDIQLIKDHLDDYSKTKLVIIDPIGSFIGGKVDTNTDNQVRAVLTPLKAIAEKHGVTFVLIAHHNKSKGTDPDELILGSRAFSAVSRSCLHVFEDRDDHNRKLLLPGKCNVGKKAPAFATRCSKPRTACRARSPLSQRRSI
jgi:hypothetical protein